MRIEEYTGSFIDGCRELGLASGDIIYISSDVTRLTMDACRKCGVRGRSGIDGFYASLTDALQGLVGKEGTLLFPMFTWSFCRGIPYDVRTTQGEVGAFGNWILNNRWDFVRTEHPIYSFMVWGRDEKLLERMHNRSAWSEDSPFGYMNRAHAKSLLIDTSLEDCFTFAHYVEESAGVPFRYYKDFHGSYTDKDGNESNRTYTMYVRDMDIDSSQVTPDNCLIDYGVAVMGRAFDIPLQVVDLAAAYPFIVKNYHENNCDEWYDFKGYVVDWTSGQTHPDETTMVIQ